MIIAKTANQEAYFRKMAIDGIIANIDMTSFNQMSQEIHKIGVNINQIAKVANATGVVYPREIKGLEEMLDDIWCILRKIF